ncbi:alpha-glucosidase [Nitritalea halalkaliphila LW7]|uniref:Alpha-glucosidase n=1 Tax=Nitritalea halalkaliphila LW7 TaxID=1189621 RepID=I5C9I6_9BACT|nr:alpha-glucosidase [Nitritalea halalkaliphila LW7]
MIIARRKGEQWFLGGITNEQERRVKVPLDFLGPRSFVATSYADTPETDMDENPTAIAIEKREVNSRQSLEFTMKPGGGFAVQFTP